MYSRMYATVEAKILSIPMTHVPLLHDLPQEVTVEYVERLYYDALEGAPQVVSELLGLIEKFPDCPVFKNYLFKVYSLQNQKRQARKVQEQILEQHPDYLFGKISAAFTAVLAGDYEKAKKYLGANLDIQTLCPERTVFHVSEVCKFYALAASIYAHMGDIIVAEGLLSALIKLDAEEDSIDFVKAEIVRSNSANFFKFLKKKQRDKIEVVVPDYSRQITATERPRFDCPEVAALYDYDLTIPEDVMMEVLHLPREVLVADLIRVLEDAIERSPYFLEVGPVDEETCFPIHAIHFLGELTASEALDTVLRFMSLHPDVLDYWMGDFFYPEPLSLICRGRFGQLKEWMKLPGISVLGKNQITAAVKHLGLNEPEHRADVLDFYQEVLEFYLTCFRKDNIIDTSLISFMVGELMALRAVELQPLIERLWEKGYIMPFVVGDLKAILEELVSPPDEDELQPRRDIVAQYDDFMDIMDSDSIPYLPDLFTSATAGYVPEIPVVQQVRNVVDQPGRNDICLCGSGKKYKKCCMPK